MDDSGSLLGIRNQELPAKKRKRRENVFAEPPCTKLFICGITVNLPPGLNPYLSQRQIMIRIIQGLKSSTNVMIESPTGSGKTMALLAPVCAWLDDYKRLQRDKLLSCPEHGTVVPSRYSSNTSIDALINKMDTSAYMQHCRNDPMDSMDESSLSSVVDIHESLPEDSILTDIGPELPKCHCLPEVRVYYASRTHRQISQVVKEFSRLPCAGMSVKHSILASRKHSCLNLAVKHSEDITKACKEMTEHGGHGCIYKNNLKAYDRMAVKLRADIERAGLVVWDIEQLSTELQTPMICPYYASTHVLSQISDITFTPYNYLMDPKLRSAAKINLKNSIIVLDEAHNLEQICKDASSFQFKEMDTIIGLNNLKEILHNLATTVSNMEAMDNYDKQIKILDNYRKQVMTLSILLKSLLRLFNTITKIIPSKGEHDRSTGKTFTAVELEELLKGTECDGGTLILDQPNDIARSFRSATARSLDIDTYELLHPFMPQTITMDTIENFLAFSVYYWEPLNRAHYVMNVDNVQNFPHSKNESVLNLWCMLPAVACKQTFKDCHSVILASGTLCPTKALKSEIGLAFSAEIEGVSAIPKNRVFASVVPKGRTGRKLTCTYNGIDGNFYLDLSLLILDVCSVVPKGVIVFVSSYRILDALGQQMSSKRMANAINKYKRVFFEPRDAGQLDTMLSDYSNAIHTPKVENLDGALLIAVYRGKVSEGIDFTDNLARCVMCVGIPYPNSTDEYVKQKKSYNNNNVHKMDVLNGHEWYSTQAYRALNQALGRCLRHKTDWGAILLVDERYRNTMNPSNPDYKKISAWIRSELTLCDTYKELMTQLQSFIRLKTIEDNGLET